MQNNSSQIYKAREVFEKKLPFLLMRNKIIASIKNFFSTENFTEVDTPILQYCPGMEVHLMAFETKFVNITGEPSKTLYLHTSPEFAMKKLLSFGMENIFQFTHTFRNEIISPTHYPEFTMLEWYRLNHDYTKLMSDCEEILKSALTSIGKLEFVYGEKTCTPFNGIEKLTIQEAFQKFCHFDILATIDNPNTPSKTLLETEAKKLQINVSEIDTWDDIYEKLMFEYIEPNLGIGRPTILYEYPIHQAALSKAKSGVPNIAERFELYICGVEIANAFTELTDEEIQRKRFEQDMQTKKDLYGITYPIDESFLEAIKSIDSATGIAMGIDRLIMLTTGAKDIKEVLWTEIPTL
ncbi:MAG: EF-P lysine aminoacylase GenX [Alphaproteobacteria bacterium]|nr:EF-P lysine aminoacylase GenX [Alphaproteobacteria bacterium]